MLVCVRCQVEMFVEKNGVGVDLNDDTYAADRYECPVCGLQILNTNKLSSYDPTHEMYTEYMKIEGLISSLLAK